MTELEYVTWFLFDWAMITLYLAVIVGFFLGWGLAAVLAMKASLGARGVFAYEIRGFQAWSLAFVLQALSIFIIGAYFFLLPYVIPLDGRHWVFIFPYAAVLVVYCVLAAILSNRASTLSQWSR